MPLRTRLPLLYTSIVGGILLLLGTAVYVAVSISLVNQRDDILSRTAYAIINKSQVDINVITLPPLDLSQNLLIQVWNRDYQLIRKNFPTSFTGALDPVGLHSITPIWRDVKLGDDHLRVLTVPIVIEGSQRLVGTLQLATYLNVVESTQRVLLIVLVIGIILSTTTAGLAAWISTKQALTPLEAVTQNALQITRADDLSRRIPYQGPENDEVGQLIRTFNQTLSRLENLFNSQRRFLADVGHELRTPLTVIKGNMGLMRRMSQIDDESMASIESEVDRLTRLVGDLLLLAQAESGKLPLARRLVELDTVLLEVLHQMRVLAKDRMQMRLGEIDQVLVCGDQDRLKQVVVNLIGNAIKYTPPDGEVLVGLGKVDNRARLTVSDTGPGIPSEDLPHIFERFYRGEKSRTRTKEGKGFGLGLSIAYWIVRNHGGQIEVAPREPKGTTFCVWLPLAQGDCQEEPKS